MPFGGKRQMTPAEGMVATLPLLHGTTKTATAMTFGFNPYLMSWSPFHGAVYSIIEAITKMVAVGGDYSKIRLTLQEYFESLGKDHENGANRLRRCLVLSGRSINSARLLSAVRTLCPVRSWI